jgi:hypothetical protein
MTAKTMSLGDFLTDKQINDCIRLCDETDGAERHAALRDQIIAPHMGEINRKLGQENDADYLAYTVEYAVIMVRTGGAA